VLYCSDRQATGWRHLMRWDFCLLFIFVEPAVDGQANSLVLVHIALTPRQCRMPPWIGQWQCLRLNWSSVFWMARFFEPSATRPKPGLFNVKESWDPTRCAFSKTKADSSLVSQSQWFRQVKVDGIRFFLHCHYVAVVDLTSTAQNRKTPHLFVEYKVAAAGSNNKMRKDWNMFLSGFL